MTYLRATALGLGLGILAPAFCAEPLPIAGRRELFVDDALVGELRGSARRVLHHPIPREEVFRPDAAWEGPTSAYFSLFADGDRYRLYYRGTSDDAHPHPELTCTAESTDGLVFSRPRLDLFEFNGERGNNIVLDDVGTHNFSPFLDAREGVPEDERYKAVGGRPIYAFASADGYRWRLLSDQPIITEGAFDSHNLAFWDAERGVYACYLRIFRDGVRDIARSVSTDFRHWSQPVPLDYGAAPPEQLYTNNILPYFRAPHLLIGMPARFLPQRRKLADRASGGVSDAVLMSSRDGQSFQRWREAFILPGPDPGNWGDRTNYPVWGLIQTSPTEMSVYWWEHYRYPDMRLRRGTLRLDGFVSVRAEMDGGQLLTKPFIYSGQQLLVNYATSAAGSLRFELCAEDGQPLPGLSLADSEELFGDEIEHAVSWAGQPDLALHAGQPVRLRVELRDADLYAIRFGELP